MKAKRAAHEVDRATIEENATTPEIKAFALSFNSILESRGIHQEEVARKTGIATGSISGYRNGTKEPRLSRIVKMADALGVDVDRLVRGVSCKHSNIHKVTSLSEKAISTLELASLEKRRLWGEVLSELITHPWILDALHAYFYLDIDSIATWDEDERAKGNYKTRSEYEKLVALADSKRGQQITIAAASLGDALLLKAEGELRKLKDEVRTG